MSRLFGPVIQLGYVVPDIQIALKHWIDVIGVGPFFLFEHMHPPEAEYRGNPTDVDISAAFSYSGEQQIELIVQHNSAPSVYADFLASHPEGGLHHFAFWTDGNDALLERLALDGQKFEVAQRYGTDHSYLSSDRIPGTMIQLMHATDAYLGLFEMIRKASTDWDGANPIRSLTG
jgi:hypothetical protein